jgi:hypothetical protein
MGDFSSVFVPNGAVLPPGFCPPLGPQDAISPEYPEYRYVVIEGQRIWISRGRRRNYYFSFDPELQRANMVYVGDNDPDIQIFIAGPAHPEE